MTIALIGLIGVVAGALVAGLFTYQVERRRRIDTAQAVGPGSAR
jgi:ABC-type lipoprotein release transport system permease subunit